MLEKVIDYLKSNNWQYSLIKDKNIAVFGISGENGKFQCIADVIEDEFKFIFFSICGVNAPIEKRNILSELITHLNWGLFLGNFEMDFEDGEIRFKTSVFYKNIDISKDVIEYAIIANIISMDKALPAIMEILYGSKSLLEAIDLVKDIKN